MYMYRIFSYGSIDTKHSMNENVIILLMGEKYNTVISQLITERAYTAVYIDS